MKPEAQRIAIAEACGWKFTVTDEGGEIKYPNGFRVEFCPVEWAEKRFFQVIPDYLNDLNAMHEAEEVLTDRVGYLIELGGCVQDAAVEDWWLVAHATAAQRAEAFLKTIGKWEDEL